jgi:hypothetical protein
METPTLFEDQKKLLDSSSITPDHVRGLSLGKLTEQYGTIGLYTRLIDTLEQTGLGDNELVQISLQLGLALHANDTRTNGHYNDHLMRVTLRMLEDFNIRDPNLIAAGPLHDTFEDHPRDLILALTGEAINDKETALSIGHQALASITNEEVADIVWAVTNPLVEPGGNKLERYAEHTTQLVFRKPKPRVLKLADFSDNAVGNHATIGEKQRKLDEKYIRMYRIHKLGLFLPDSLIKGKERTQALHLLSKGHARALGRIASNPSPY